MKALALIAIALFMVGCEGGYRYECQDELNWGKAECQRPACEAAGGICSDVLVYGPEAKGKNMSGEEQTPVIEESATEADCNCNTGE
jgi:hypothetical protein